MAVMHLYCLCHKAHSAATRTWDLLLDLISNLVHTVKVMAFAGAMSLLKDNARRLVQERFKVMRLQPSEESQRFRGRILRFFGPGRKHPRRYALMEVFLEFFNGRWEEPGTLQHCCSGPSCCRNEQASTRKAMVLVTRFLSTFRPGLFNKGNWLEWAQPLPFFVIADSMHFFLADAYKQTFMKGAQNEAADARDPFQTDVVLHVAATPELGEGLADDHAGAAIDAAERVKAENAISLRQSLEFMRRGMWQQVFMMRVCLDAEKNLVNHLVFLCSAEWEQRQMGNHNDTGERQYRLALLHEDTALQHCRVLAFENFASETLWAQFSQSEHFRTKLLQLHFRAASVIYQLVEIRLRGYPWKLFNLLSARTVEARQQVARAVLQDPRCVYDRWTRCFLQRYSTEERILSQESLLLLELVARKARASTFSTEALHSRNLRRALARHSTHKPDVKHLALAHLGKAGPVWMPEIEEKSCHAATKRGRPKKKGLRRSSAKSHGQVAEGLGGRFCMSICKARR